jgi:hypothetical protein
MCFSSYYKRENYNTKSIIECTCVCMKTLTCGRKYKSMQGVRKNVICYIRPVVGWYNLGININEKLKIFFSNFNEKLKGVVKKDKNFLIIILGKRYHKANCINSVINKITKLSSDRIAFLFQMNE